jgi:uncharacterized membrane protein
MRAISAVLLETLRSRLWFVPGLAAIAAAVAAIVVLLVEPDSTPDSGWFTLDAASARSVLSAISGAMISFTALVFSITMLVLQQASSQLSPRVMRTFLRDRLSQSVLGLFVAAFVFALLILLGIGPDSASWLGVSIALVLVMAAVLAFVAYIDHMGHSIRPTNVIRAIGDETRAAIDRNYPAADDADSDAHAAGADGAPAVDDPLAADVDAGDHEVHLIAWTGRSGYVQALDEGGLLGLAKRAERSMRLTMGVGDYLVQGAPFLALAGEVDVGLDDEDRDVAGLARTGNERTMSQDPEFGFSQLTDIALRALSPSLNDPTTAVQVIDQLHDLLRLLLGRPIPSPRVLRSDEGASVLVPAPDWDAYVRASVDQVARAGHGHPVIAQRLRLMLEDLARDCPAEREPAIRRALAVTEED